MGKPLHWIVIFQLVSFAFPYRYDSWYRADAQRPVDVITDVVNDLGAKILQQYTMSGNVAFSPTGIAFVLTALYEGSAGRGSQQISEAMGLPPSRDVTRIGFRDIHRRLRSYLNADGFLGGLTLSKENIRLRPEYEDILRFYGFDLSSIEQEANVTVSMGDSSGTTEIPASTTETTTLPVEMTNNANVPGATTMLTDTIATLPPVVAETTIAPSIAPDTTQQPVTTPMGGTDVQPTLAPTIVSPGAITQNILVTQSGDSLTTVTSGESVQPPPAVGAESMAVSPNTVTPNTVTPNTVTPMVDTASTPTMDSQMSPSTVTMIVDNQSPLPTSPTITAGATNDIVTNVTAANAPVAPNVDVTGGNVGSTNMTAPEVPNDATQGAPVIANTTTAAAVDVGATVSVSVIDAEVSSTLAMNTISPTTMSMSNLDSSTTIATDTTNQVPVTSNTMDVNAMSVDTMSVTNAAVSDTTNSLTSTIPTDNSVTSRSNTEASMSVNTEASMSANTEASMSANTEASMSANTEASMSANTEASMSANTEASMSANTEAGSTPVMTTISDFITMPIGVISEGAMDVTSMNLAENPNSTIANSTMNLMSMDNQTAVDENTISMNRKKKAIESEIGLLSNLNINGITVKDESSGSPNPRKRKTRSPRGYFSSYPDEGIWMQDLEIWKSYTTASPDDSSGDSATEISFLINGCDVSTVSASRYIAVLPFAYFPSLQAVALEFPLDDPRYNIILLMPTDKTDTHRLARDLSGKSLRSLRKLLQLTWVRATIPSFMLRGFVTLTSFLQRLGISNVFEPRVADLSPMTSELGVYARDVQQSIGVNIRNYMKPDRTHSRESSNVVPPRRDYYRYLPPGNGLFERAGPVPFTALHPFLYFIVDTETSVSLIAGRVDDPLNSRIL